MAHLIQQMAYVGQTPWHELGNQLPPKQPLEVWARSAGMDWRICETPVRYMAEQAGALGSIRTFEDQKVLYRSDTKAPLSVVGGRYRIARDETMIAQLIELERRFWHFVEADTAPPADGSESADVALRALWPRDNGETVDLTGDMEMSSAFSDLLALRQILADAVARESQVKQRIQQRMGEAATARFDAGEVRWKRSKDAVAVDIDRLLVDQPGLASAYSVSRPGSRRFTVKVHESMGQP